MASHLADVASSTTSIPVKPWFAGQLDFSPPVVDLADRGCRSQAAGWTTWTVAPVAALVYRSRVRT